MCPSARMASWSVTRLSPHQADTVPRVLSSLFLGAPAGVGVSALLHVKIPDSLWYHYDVFLWGSTITAPGGSRSASTCRREWRCPIPGSSIASHCALYMKTAAANLHVGLALLLLISLWSCRLLVEVLPQAFFIPEESCLSELHMFAFWASQLAYTGGKCYFHFVVRKPRHRGIRWHKVAGCWVSLNCMGHLIQLAQNACYYLGNIKVPPWNSCWEGLRCHSFCHEAEKQMVTS